MKKIVRNIFKRLMPYGYRDITIPFPQIKYKSLDRRKYKGYCIAGGYGDKMLPYIDYVKKRTSLKVENVFEIGANFAQDADFLREAFNLAPKNVYVFEAHPDIYKAITQIHDFNAYNNAVFNENKKIIFNVYPLSLMSLNYNNTGLSSIHEDYSIWE